MEQKWLFKVGIMISAIGLVIMVIFAINFVTILNQLFVPNILPNIPPQTTKINSINWDENTNQIRVFAEYTGNGTITLEEVYANETLDAEAIIVNRVLCQDQTTEIILSEKYITKPNRITIRIASSEGPADFYKTKIFYEIGMRQVDWDKKTSKITLVVKNYGDETVTLNQVYVNGGLDASALPNPKILETEQEAVVILSEPFIDTYEPIPIKVMTLEGVSAERSDPIFGLWVQSINWNSNTGKIIAYLYDQGYEGMGDGEVTQVYVNGTLDSLATIDDRGDDFWAITLSKIYENNPHQLTLKVVTSEGAFGELTMQPPNEFHP